ncbi:uncharacterized protein LOC121876507 [Homarus americanus]|uniref:uncharacterized protein LOC121876507 n=1 Tax=Homarus americanus TaxID=6706 RepID=UPI001C486778|nr:uncharacterized protein LOC121876507 [Homarus americanus]
MWESVGCESAAVPDRRRCRAMPSLQDAMEVVSVAANVGEVLGGPQPPTTPTFSHDHAIHAHTDHTDRVRPDEDEDEYEGDSRMDTDQDLGGEDATCDPEDVPEESSVLDMNIFKQEPSSHPLEEESNHEPESAPLDDDVPGDLMDCDDSESAPMFIDDDSSSRAFPETTNDAPVGSPSTALPMPEAGRRNKRKNFKPRNIVYTYTDSEDTEGTSDAETRSHLAASDPHYDTAVPEPLDLSETPTMRRSLMPRRLDEAVDLTGGAGVSVSSGGVSSPSAHPRLNALLSRPTSPGPHEDGGGADASDMKEYAELTMRRLLGLYGLNDLPDNLGLPPPALYPGTRVHNSCPWQTPQPRGVGHIIPHQQSPLQQYISGASCTQVLDLP